MGKIASWVGTVGGWLALIASFVFVASVVTFEGPDCTGLPPTAAVKRGVVLPSHASELDIEDNDGRQYARIYIDSGRVKMAVWTHRGLKTVDMTRLAERFGD